MVFEELIGKRLGQYRIERKIGEGGMATVFKAYQPSLKRWVAVKVLSEELARKQDYISRFEREARVAANLDHHHIVKVFDYDTQDNYYYIVMSYVEGSRTLADLIRKDVPKDKLLGYILQVAEALEYAHKEGAIHRDVKPSNILIRRDGWPLLADFGLVRSETTIGDLTRTGMQMGTQGYMSPEQRQGIQVDHRTDIYALGAILYKVLTGETPPQTENYVAIALKQRRDISKRLKQVILCALADDPYDRFWSTAEFKAELQKAVQARGGRLPIVPIAIGALTIVIAVAGALVLSRTIFEVPTPVPSPAQAASPIAAGARPSPTITASTPKSEPTSPPTATGNIGSERETPATEPIPTLVPPQVTSTPIPPTETSTATKTPSPTTTPTPTATATRPTSTATLAPTASPTAPATQAPAVPAGKFVLLKPAPPDISTAGLTEFEWQWNGPLAADQGFEIRVWREGEPPAGVHDAVEDNLKGRVESLDDNTYRLVVDITNAPGVRSRNGEYLWTVFLVQITPNYLDLDIQATPGRLRVEVPGGTGSDDGDTKPTP